MELVTVREIYRDTEKYLNQKITVGGWLRSVNDEKSEYVIVQEQGYEDENPFALKVIKDEEDNDMFELIEDEVELAAIEEAYNTIFSEEE